MQGGAHERRLMNRYGLVRTAVGWRLDRVDYRPVESRRLSPLRPEYAELLDVSVTGARLLAPYTTELQLGSRTVMEVMGVSGTVIIRHIGACTDLTRSLYGVEFAEPNSALPALVYDAFIVQHARVRQS
jgi:hypothetical protein